MRDFYQAVAAIMALIMWIVTIFGAVMVLMSVRALMYAPSSDIWEVIIWFLIFFFGTWLACYIAVLFGRLEDWLMRQPNERFSLKRKENKV